MLSALDHTAKILSDAKSPFITIGNTAMRRAVREFTGIARNADIAVIYYAGHGIEFDGTNYLIPVDAELASDVDVDGRMP